jgi:hypothetical protein
LEEIKKEENDEAFNVAISRILSPRHLDGYEIGEEKSPRLFCVTDVSAAFC